METLSQKIKSRSTEIQRCWDYATITGEELEAEKEDLLIRIKGIHNKIGSNQDYKTKILDRATELNYTLIL